MLAALSLPPLREGGGGGAADIFAVIWTTTAWTIPANQALNLNPEIVYALVDTPRGRLILAEVLVEKALARYKLEGKVLATTEGNPAGLEFQHPLYDADAGYRRLSPVYLADYATAEDGTGIVHSSPAYGLDDFNSCVAHGMKYDDILNPVQGNGSYAPDFPCSAARTSGSRSRTSSTPWTGRAGCRPPRASPTAIRIAGGTRRR